MVSFSLSLPTFVLSSVITASSLKQIERKNGVESDSNYLVLVTIFSISIEISPENLNS